MSGTHYTPLVALSFLIAICASYTALSLAGRVAIARGRTRAAWLLGGSIAMGSGIWSMHFVAMLAFHLPVSISYDVPLVALSHLVAVAASAFALWVAGRASVGKLALVGAGVCLGLAVVAMHYTGMAAVRVPAHLGYDPVLVAASVLIAVVASTVALWLFLRLRHDNTDRGRAFRAAAAVVMGFAIAGMHYTAMAAAHFTPMAAHEHVTVGLLLGTKGLAVPVVMGAFVILSLTLVGSITDHWVRAQLAAAAALRESEERYRTVVSEIDEVIFRTDADGNWTFLNSAWRKITGFTPEESLGRAKTDFVHPEDRESSLEQCRSLAAGHEFYSQELRYVTRNEGPRWVEVHGRATRNELGKLIGTAGVIRDITERRRVEEALRAASEASAAASRAKSEFLSRMSHELRTPLNAILGFGQLMELEASTPDQHESATQILKGGRHLLALINEVLDITGIESGHLTMSIEPVQVQDVLTEVMELMGPLATARRVSMAIAPASANLFVHADRQRFKQVLLNLVANAVKYNREGGSVRVACIPSASGIRVSVTDTGDGIPESRISRLFTPFDRLGVEQQVEGTGLGLALSKRLIEAMQGSIGVDSAAGQGSTFWVELPAAENPQSRLHDAVAARTSGQFDRSGGKILYVEDNLSNLALMQRLLARHDHIELIPAMSGGLALDLARQHQPDLILLDLHLPDIPGEDVLAVLRQDIQCRDIPVVVLSADATPGQIERLTTAGARAYLTKPLDLKPFMTLLDDILTAKVAA